MIFTRLCRLGVALLLALSPLLATAQADSPTPCGTDQAMRRALGSGYEAWWSSYRGGLRTRTQAHRPASGSRLIIPVVIHIIHNGLINNISDEQVFDAIRILNEDFQKHNADTLGIIPPFQSRIGDVNIEFRLARRDPQGNCTNGITRTYSTLTSNADDNVKQLIGWDGNRYLNIWVVSRISFGAAGYAYLPCGIGPANDGIVILHGYIGSIGTANPRNSRALTHEVGHYLGLPHTWGMTNAPGPGNNNCLDDDGVADTPNTEGSGVGICNLNLPACPGDPDPLSNVQNYMDYSYCAAMFTAGQAELMNDGLASGFFPCHSPLVAAQNLQQTGVEPLLAPCPPVALISADGMLSTDSLVRACVGDSIRMRGTAHNLPANAAVTWQWQFPGGQPATSTRRNPAVVYPAPGTYSVSLTATNAGVGGSVTRTGFVHVGSPVGGLTTPTIAGFEDPQFPLDATDPLRSWEIEAGTPGATWEYTSAAAQQGTGAVRLRLRNVPDAARHALVSPNIVVSNTLQRPTLRFQVAYAQSAATNLDKLEVAYSTDCGHSWQTRLRRSGAALAHGNAPTNSAFVPTAAQWHDEQVVLGSVLPAGNPLRLRFTLTTDQGSALYLDEVRLESQPLDVAAEMPVVASLAVVPNPSDGRATLRLILPATTTGTLRLLDATGRRLGTKTLHSGEQTLELSEVAGRLAAGVYLVELTTADGTRQTQRALVL